MSADICRSIYFNWLYDQVCHNRFAPDISYRKMFHALDQIPFTWTIPRDENRAEDGISLRHRCGLAYGYLNLEDSISKECSVLEMLVALAIRCEEDIMSNVNYGDRTGQWFWQMICNIGLGSMSDDKFNVSTVRKAAHRFMDRAYNSDGSNGGLFRIRNCTQDLREVEIWVQMLWYLDTLP